MSKEKQIDEMAHELCGVNVSCKDCGLNNLCLARNSADILYNAGYRKQSEWISVEERLPDDNGHCLVFLPSGHLYDGIHVARYSHKTNMWIDLDTTYLYNYVTHWMPLPEAPKMKGGE